MPPYISDAERERAQWMTLTELTADVTKHHPGRPADQQIRNALSDGKLITKWEDATAHQRRRRQPTDPPPMIGEDGYTVPDWPPRKGGFWQKARIDGDKVFDPETKRWRTLLLLRSSLQQAWKERPPAPPPPTGGRPPYRDKIKERLVGIDLTNVTDAHAIRHVQETWPDSDGKCPHKKTIGYWVRELRDEAEKTEKI